ncbi:DUF4249 family protein [Aquimarina sp. 2201CG5-10]|uniref:DUF4249 family protein n=1 Tax=Aquimarina callyspongiae TaxID=3098150 RepID=UPI002AB3F3D9|nr:DUF4249 family protein [Aquimarina sp. 2201CG5-10]MDY8134006.1 DUF4249 family protein [Aquimarina sp. 2201CG5-10]
MKNIFITTAIILTILIFTSCETDVTNDITLEDSDPRLVINGGLERNTITPLTTQRLQLTTTASFLSTGELPFVSDASVTITDGSNSWVFTHSNDGFYENSEIIPELGKTYTITINWNGEIYEGVDSLTEVPQFDNFYFEYEEETLVNDAGYFVKFDTTDPINIPNFYYYRLFKNDEFIIVPDPGTRDVLIVSDEFFDGRQRIGVNPNDEVAFDIGDVGKAQQLSISEPYFDFLTELFTQTGNIGNPIIGNPPPASIRGNLINLSNPNNRALGYFYTVDVEEDTITITEN